MNLVSGISIRPTGIAAGLSVVSVFEFIVFKRGFGLSADACFCSWSSSVKFPYRCREAVAADGTSCSSGVSKLAHNPIPMPTQVTWVLEATRNVKKHAANSGFDKFQFHNQGRRLIRCPLFSSFSDQLVVPAA